MLCLQHYRNARFTLPPALIQLAPEFAVPPKPSSKPSGRPQRMQRPRQLRIKKIVIAAHKAKAVAKKRSASFPPPKPRRLRQDPG